MILNLINDICVKWFKLKIRVQGANFYLSMNNLTFTDHGNLNCKAFVQRLKMPWDICYNHAGALLTRYFNTLTAN